MGGTGWGVSKGSGVIKLKLWYMWLMWYMCGLRLHLGGKKTDHMRAVDITSCCLHAGHLQGVKLLWTQGHGKWGKICGKGAWRGDCTLVI